MLVENLVLLHDASTSMTDAVLAWAAQPAPTPTTGDGSVVDRGGIIQFIITKIAPILLAVIGVIFISRAGKGEMSRVLTSSAIAILGIVFIVGGIAMFAFSQGLVTLIFGPTP